MNINRIFPQAGPRTAGCFGLVSRMETTRIILPLKGVQCDFSMAGGLVEVIMTQIFRQENAKPLDCDYLFPLPADAAVYGCEADINGRVIRAQVRERGEAVRLAAQKKAEGRRVMLVEAERENLFTLSLNNLQPEDLIVVKLKYIQPIRFLADLPSIEIPFCPGIRYIPGNPLIRANRGRGVIDDTEQVPDASRISPVRIDPSHPDAAFIELRGILDGKFVDPASLMSPSHNVISHVEAGKITIRLSDKDEVPDRDFVMRWQEKPAENIAARAWVHTRGDEHYALLEIRAPKAEAVTVAPMDFYFLVDRSGSMNGLKWHKAALAVQSCVAALAPEDRVMITLFGSHFNDFAEQPQSPGQLVVDVNFQKLQDLPMDGGTLLAPALHHVLEISAAHSVGRPKSLILITDAQVGNEPVILKILESVPDFPVHSFGIDIALNDALLLGLARQQNGTFHSLNPADDVAGAVTRLAQTIRHPVLTDLKLSGTWDLADASIPPLYAGQTYYLSARSPRQEELELTARNGSETRANLPFSAGISAGDAPYLRWCKNRIQSCLARHNPVEAIALSIKSNLICPLTAFITWDESEKVAIARQSLAQPVFGMSAGLTRGEHAQYLVAPSTEYCLRAEAGPRNLQEVNTEFDYLMADPSSIPEYPHPDPDQEMVRIIVGDPHVFHQINSRQRFTREEERAAFHRLFIKICERCRRPDWIPLCERVLAWTFDDKAAAYRRSLQLAMFLRRLLKDSEKCETLGANSQDTTVIQAEMQRQLGAIAMRAA